MSSFSLGFPRKDSSFHRFGWLWAEHSSFADLCQAVFILTGQTLKRLWLSAKKFHASASSRSAWGRGQRWDERWQGCLGGFYFFHRGDGAVCVNKIMYFFCLWHFCVDCCYKGKNTLNILNLLFVFRVRTFCCQGLCSGKKYWIFLVWATSIVGESSGCVSSDVKASCVFLQNKGSPMVPLQQLRGDNTIII